MLFKSILALSASLTLAAATPVPAASTNAKAPQQYYLRSHHATHSRHDNLYLGSWHTGAGLADAVFNNNTVDAPAMAGYLNVTAWVFDIDYPAGFTMDYDGDEFHSVEVNALEADTIFGIDKSGLVWDSEAFGAWLICDWWWGVPQLFWLNSGSTAPKGCSTADLIPELAEN